MKTKKRWEKILINLKTLVLSDQNNLELKLLYSQCLNQMIEQKLRIN